jgi:hypothetical protein
VKFTIQLEELQIRALRDAICERKEEVRRELKDYLEDEERDSLQLEFGILCDTDGLLREALRGSPA